MARVSIFRTFKHPQLENLGIKGGVADASFLKQAVDNTNRLIREKRHTPPIKETHAGQRDGSASGWVDSTATDGKTMFADMAFTPRGKQRITDREFRYVSASFRKDFALTGEPDGEKLPGVFLDHVAVLGSDNPAVKQLTDLSEIQFSDNSDASTRAWVQFADNEVTVFSEVAPSEPEEDSMAASEVEKRLELLEAKFAVMSNGDMTNAKKECACCAKDTPACDCASKDKTPGNCSCSATCAGCTKMSCGGMHAATGTSGGSAQTSLSENSSSFTEGERKRLYVAEAKLQEMERSIEAAKFSEYKSKVGDRIKQAQRDLKLGHEKATTLLAKAEKVYGNAEAEAMFSELLDSIAPVVPTKRIGNGEDGEGRNEYGASAADFSETIADPASLQRAHAATVAYLSEHSELGEGTVAYLKARTAVKKAVERSAN